MIKFNFHMLIVVMSLQRVVLPRVSILVLLLTCEELKSVTFELNSQTNNCTVYSRPRVSCKLS